jgi:Zn-dependent M28 family amino/carboxypeptidase
VFHEDHDVAVAYLEAAFAGLGLEVETVDFEWSIEEDCETYSGTGRNIVARLEGADPDLEPVFITAHYDSSANLDESWDPSADPAPGASDNASGVAIALELARVLVTMAGSEPAPRTFVFALFDAEELGLLGSYAYVEAMPADAALLCTLNIDMVAWDLELWPGRYWYAFHPDFSDLASFDVEAIGELVPEASPILSDAVTSLMFSGSDHLPFWEAGYCATYFSNWPVTGTYHTPGDQVDTYDWPFFMTVARSAAAVFTARGYRWE